MMFKRILKLKKDLKKRKKHVLSASEMKYNSYLFGAPYEVCGYPKEKEVKINGMD